MQLFIELVYLEVSQVKINKEENLKKKEIFNNDIIKEKIRGSTQGFTSAF